MSGGSPRSALFTRFMRATETTDRLRHDGGAYLRLWDERERFCNRALHARLQAGASTRAPGGAPSRETGAAAPERDLMALRRAAGLSGLPFYCLRRLPRDAAGRAAPAGCRVAVWEETSDLWKHRLLRLDLDAPATAFTVPAELLHRGSRFAVVLYSRGPGGYSATGLAPFLYRPGPDDPLLDYAPTRPERLWPDEGASRPVGADVDPRWSIRDPERSQAAASVAVIADGCLADDLAPVFEARLEYADARGCACTVPAARLRAGHAYAWYVTAHTSDGRTAFAPSEGLFTITRGG